MLSLLREHPVLEVESFRIKMRLRKFSEELLDHACFGLRFFFNCLLLIVLLLDREYDLEELIELDLARAIVIILLHQLLDLLH